MGEETKRILKMVANGKISADEGERLLGALASGSERGSAGEAPNDPVRRRGAGGALRYLRVVVEPDPSQEKGERVNIRVPLKLIRSGLKWASFIPGEAREQMNKTLNEKGIDLDISKMSGEDLDELMQSLDDLTVDVEGKEKIRIFCE